MRITARCFLVAVLAFVLLHLAAARPLAAQYNRQRADSLMRVSLSMFDLPPFVWGGQPDPLRPRLGVYVNAIPDDSMALIPGVQAGERPVRVWHVMPHWLADDGGMLIGDLIVSLNGHPIGDTVYQYDDYLNMTVRGMSPGDTARFRIVRAGVARDLMVPVRAPERAPMPVPPAPAGLGPVVEQSWLARTLEQTNLTERARTIQKQMCVVADQDFCTVPFTQRRSPWRLNAVTYLHHNPTRIGAFARQVCTDIWGSVERNGIAGAVATAASGLDVSLPTVAPEPILPASMSTLRNRCTAVANELHEAFRAIRYPLDSLVRGLSGLLDIDSNWEAGLDTVKDPVRHRELRIAEEKRMAALLGAADGLDRISLFQAGALLAGLADSSWLVAFVRSLPPIRSSVPVAVPGVEGTVLQVTSTPFGRIVIGGPGHNRYTGDFAVIIDVGGDDLYQLPPVGMGGFRYVGDVAGNDFYNTTATGQAAGLGAVDVLFDLAGDDTYRAGHFSQGAGLLGVGVLVDHAGNDVYDARWCSQGAAFLGIGLLCDRAGDDQYTSQVYSQGFGYARGFGAILEFEGNDAYRAGWKIPDSRYPNRAYLAMSQGFGFGMRPWGTGIGTDGGIGVLTDRTGDDVYASDYFSQGGSYWYALGILHDGAGADRYTAGQYSQGSGIHLSFGALLDDAGDDMYDAYAGLEQGNAHDWSAGCLEDASGNDTYRGSNSSQGSALTVSFAWLLDAAGDDMYYAKLSDSALSQGGGNANRVRGSGSIGLLIDRGSGADYVTEPRVVPGTPVVKGNGIVFDDGPAK